MDKKQKYIDYVAGELLKVITINDDVILFPWYMEDITYEWNDPLTEFYFYKSNIMELKPFKFRHDSHGKEFFDEYVTSRFGVREEEVITIWLELKKRLHDKSLPDE